MWNKKITTLIKRCKWWNKMPQSKLREFFCLPYWDENLLSPPVQNCAIPNVKSTAPHTSMYRMHEWNWGKATRLFVFKIESIQSKIPHYPNHKVQIEQVANFYMKES
jgi:hypothetical protein